MGNLEPAMARLAEACQDCGHVRGEHYVTFDCDHYGCAHYDDLVVVSDDCGECQCSGFRDG